MNAPRALIATILRLFASLAALSVAPSVRKGVRKGVAFAVHYILYLDLRSIACLLHLYHPTRKLCVCLHLVQTLRRSYKNANGAQYSLCDPYPQVCLLAYLPTCLHAYLLIPFFLTLFVVCHSPSTAVGWYFLASQKQRHHFVIQLKQMELPRCQLRIANE